MPEQFAQVNRALIYALIIGLFCLAACFGFAVFVLARYLRDQRKFNNFVDAHAAIIGFYNSPIPGVVTDKDGTILIVNKATENTFQWREEELRGKKVTILMPDSYVRLHEMGIERLKARGKPKVAGVAPLIAEAKNRFDDVIPVEITIQVEQLGKGVVYVASLRDMTAKKKLMADFEAMARMFTSAEDLLQVGVCQWNVQSDTVETSDGFKDIYEVETEIRDSDYYLGRVYKDDIDQVRLELAAVHRDKPETYTLKHRIMKRNGDLITVRATCKVFFLTTGAINYIMGVVQVVSHE